MHERVSKFTWALMSTYLTLHSFKLIDFTWYVDDMLYFEQSCLWTHMVSSVDIDIACCWWVTNYFLNKFLNFSTNCKTRRFLPFFNTTLRFLTIPMVMMLYLCLVECEQTHWSTSVSIKYLATLGVNHL